MYWCLVHEGVNGGHNIILWRSCSAILWKYSSIWSGYHILIYYVIQYAYEYIKPYFSWLHNTFLCIKCLLQIFGLRILGQTSFRLSVTYSKHSIYSLPWTSVIWNKNVFQASSSYFSWLNYIEIVLILSKVLVMPCFEITSIWRGYHILIDYVIQCAHAYINPDV